MVDKSARLTCTRRRGQVWLTLAATCTLLLAAPGCGDSIRSSETPDIEVIPPTYQFPKIAVGQDEPERRAVQVRNTGTGTLLIGRVELVTDTQAEEFELRWYRDSAQNEVFPGISSNGSDEFDYPLAIEPDDGVHLVLYYTLLSDQSPQGEVILQTNLPAPNDRVRIPITLAEGSAELDVNPTTLDFERVAAGTSETQDVTLTNIGQLELVINAVNVNGSQDFSPLIEDEGVLKDTRLLARERDIVKTLAPNESVSLTVKYAPPFEGPDYGELSIRTNDPGRPEVIVNLRANAQSPCVAAIPTIVEFPTSLVNRSDSRPFVLESCGGSPIEIVRIQTAEGSDPAFELPQDAQPALPLVLPAFTLEDDSAGLSPPQQTFQVSFTPREQRIHNGTIVVKSRDPNTGDELPDVELQLLGRGVVNDCPQARVENAQFSVLPFDVVVLDGSLSTDQDGPDNRPVEYEWVVTNAPAGSVARPLERFYEPAQPINGGDEDDPSTPTAVFFVDLPGTYTVELRVTDNLGLDSVVCDNATAVTITARPREELHVQLVWRTPNDMDTDDDRGTDLDLHLLHPTGEWFQQPFDCYYQNPTPDWGQQGNPEDDPLLDLDDIDGGGPENIGLSNPENTQTLGNPYIVGVHYNQSRDRFDSDVDYGESFATVRIFIRGELAWSFEQEDGTAGEKQMLAEDHFWDVAQITWPEAIVTTRDFYLTERP